MNHSRLIIAVLLMSMLLFVACTKQAPAKEAAPSVPAAKQIEISEPVEQPPAQEAEAPAQEAGGEAAPPSPPAGTPHSVTIEGFIYIPGTITIKKGDSVAWTNKDATPHTATADDDSFDTERIEEGHEVQATFSEAGTFAYHCSYHPGMHGTVVVTE